jgi:hypothetical protein
MTTLVIPTALRERCVLRCERLLTLSVRGHCGDWPAFTVLAYLVLNVASDRRIHGLA